MLIASFKFGGGRTQDKGGLVILAAVSGNVVGVISRVGVLFITVFMFFVDDDKP